jgi:ATP-dependent DNA helicase RecQ
MVKKARAILKKVFGYDEFRVLQKEIIENVLNRKDTLVIMPTGGGKSMCYQIPAIIFNGLTIVVSPLISLMEDQVSQLKALGVDAVYLNSTLSQAEYQNNVDRIKCGEVCMLYLAPETLMMPRTLSLLDHIEVDCFTIDEAHCISEWGHDFRPEYRQLTEVRSHFPKAVCIALTATATPRVQQDIKNTLEFSESSKFIASFDRKNLHLQIKPKSNPNTQCLEFLKRFTNQSGIIYCASRRQVDELSDTLNRQGFSAQPYHAGLPAERRKANQELFIRDDVQIIVATIAFGMGINKPNVRFVLHYDLPQNIESYYQQIGRAGRDGLEAQCLLLFGYGDIQKVKFFINQKSDNEKRIANMHLNTLVSLAETDECRRILLLKYFGEEYLQTECMMCDNCLEEKRDLIEVTVPAQKFLSGVKRTGEVFGAGHIIDVLRGSKGQKILDFNHQKLSIYGIGKEFSKKEWFYLSRQFIQKALISQDEEFGGLRLTDEGWKVLKAERSIFVKEEERTSKQKQTTRFQETNQEYDRALFDLLRQQRKAIADAAKLPPYIIFPDKTLIEMAIHFPQSESAFLQINGVGSVKCHKYGPTFISLILEYCQKNQQPENPELTAIEHSLGTTEKFKKERHIDVGEKFNSGFTLVDLQDEYKVKLNTIVDNLYKYYCEGNSITHNLDLTMIAHISQETQKMVIDAFWKLGTELLLPVYRELEESVNYDDLRLLRLKFIIEEKVKTSEKS